MLLVALPLYGTNYIIIGRRHQTRARTALRFVLCCSDSLSFSGFLLITEKQYYASIEAVTGIVCMFFF
jgi:hypothetical protein